MARALAKFQIKSVEKFTKNYLRKNMQGTAKLIRDRVRAFTPEDEGFLVKTIAHEVVVSRFDVTGYVGADKRKSFINDDGDKVFPWKYVRRIEAGFFGSDSLGRIYPRTRGAQMFRKGLGLSRQVVQRMLAK